MQDRSHMQNYGMCQIEEKQKGGMYPRSCPTCGLGGPCKKAKLELEPRLYNQFGFFADAVRIKLLKAQNMGRTGWNDKEWAEAHAIEGLLQHVRKGDPLDVAAYAFFLHHHRLPTWPLNES